MNEQIQDVVDRISKLSLIEAKQLKDALIEKFDVKMPQTTIGYGDVISHSPAIEVVQTEFDVILTGYPSDKKIEVIKRIRSHTGLGLIDAKKAVENLPFTIKYEIGKEEAEKIKADFDEIGPIVELK